MNYALLAINYKVSGDGLCTATVFGRATGGGRMLIGNNVDMLHVLLGALLIIAVRGQDGCEDRDYKSEIGLDFRITCTSNAPGNDIRNNPASSLESCIDQCAVALGDSNSDVACRAVSYNVETKQCYRKDGNVTSNFVFEADTITAIGDAAPFQLDASSSPCPDGNGTVHTDDNGMDYSVICGTFWSGNNFDPGDEGEGAYQPFHADTLNDCMSYCSANAPLCYGVRWEQSATNFYRNCWPKKQNATHADSKLAPDSFAIAAVGRLQVNSTCTGSDKNFTASNGATLKQLCDSSADGPDLEVVHAGNYEDCMDKCATYKSNDGGNTYCGGITYQPDASQGFRNCYLKYALSNVTAMPSWHIATLETRGGEQDDAAGGQSQGEGTTQNNQENGSASQGNEAPAQEEEGSSKTWIAGAVAGPVVGLAAIAGLVFWYHRRKKARAPASNHQDHTDHKPNAADTYPLNAGAKYYSPPMDHGYKYDPAAITPPPPFSPYVDRSPLVEMPQAGRHVVELPTASNVRHELHS
ncbi:uncharacterized protein AB675_7419 [Cyphellophora attinorum]|uniref:Apple domain-containing protein n=1 Tax=Cyphellophora attinorum TaxID=1664694 RepID=A0A0N1HGJ5_9EURO|nr:uncharacterized protein AB675_7419 [Phialophora attinorum]KPI34556.1 hypothetical protein AB675_7419 [Phialophora attinorum]